MNENCFHASGITRVIAVLMNECRFNVSVKVLFLSREVNLFCCLCLNGNLLRCALCGCMVGSVATHFYEVLSAAVHIHRPFVKRNLLSARQCSWALWENLHSVSSREARCWVLRRVKEHRGVFFFTQLWQSLSFSSLPSPGWRTSNLWSCRWPGLDTE